MPGYSAFLILCGINLSATRIVQMFLGMCITAMLFLLAWRMTRVVWLASVTALFYGLNIAQIFQESSEISETLA
ncbi:MAG: hypothetical protein ACLQUT_00230, partial [Thermoleophilia bacterium]